MRLTRASVSHAATLIVACMVMACTSPDSEEPGFALQARGGSYVDGSGRLGLAVLATLRDADGSGSWFAAGGDATVVCGRGTFDDRDDLVFTVNP